MRQKFSILIFMLFVGCVSGESPGDPTTVEIRVEPTPSHIKGLWPEPGTTYTVEEYREYRGFDQRAPGVCVTFDVQPFLAPGNFLSVEQLLTRFKAEIDGQQFAEPDYVFLRDSFGYSVFDPESGELLYEVPPGGPYFICFSTELEPGLHSVTFSGTKTSGKELSYSWSFTLE